jgi:hypothetical protein
MGLAGKTSAIFRRSIPQERYFDTRINESEKTAIIAERTGLEPATSYVTGRRSNQLNYRSI